MPDFDSATLFPDSAAIDAAAASADSRMNWKVVPAKCAVYLLVGVDPSGAHADHPYLLATVGNFRAALQRRLADDPPELRTKRVQYGQVCTRVYWRIVHSPFAANWWYWNAARSLFPDSYRQMIGWRPTWWLAVEREAAFPELHRTQDLSDGSLRYAGPIRDKAAAGKLIETVQDLFDLCRYHHILVQAPRGKACAYKEMGKCPAPCDGSVSMAWYHEQMRRAFCFITGETRAEWTADTQAAMKSAAGNLQFEVAGKIKQRLERAAFVAAEAFAHMGPLEDFAFLSLQPGQGKPYLEPWLIHPSQDPPVRCLPQIKKKDLAAGVEELFARCREVAAIPVTQPVAPPAVEQIGLLAHHLFKGYDDPGLYLRLRDITSPEILLNAATELFARKSPPKPLPEQASDKMPVEPVNPPVDSPAP